LWQASRKGTYRNRTGAAHYTHPVGWRTDTKHVQATREQLAGQEQCHCFPPLGLRYQPGPAAKNKGFISVPFHLDALGHLTPLATEQDLVNHSVTLTVSFSPTTGAIIPALCHAQLTPSEQEGMRVFMDTAYKLWPHPGQETFTLEDFQAAYEHQLRVGGYA